MGSPPLLSWPKICPVSAGLFIVSALWIVRALDKQMRRTAAAAVSDDNDNDDDNDNGKTLAFRVVFVLGAPGVGKGTQCQLICTRTNDNDPSWCHLSAGDLLRAERRKTDSALAREINACIDAGQLVRSEITCQLLQNAMHKVYQTKRCTNFLIDGYPRSQGNVDAWNRQFATASSNSNNIRIHVAFILNYICPEDLLVGRLLERGKSSGRGDDNLETIQKRFQTFQAETNPVIDWYKTNHTADIPVYDIRTDKSVEKVYQDTIGYFTTLAPTTTTTTTTTTNTTA